MEFQRAIWRVGVLGESLLSTCRKVSKIVECDILNVTTKSLPVPPLSS